MSLQDSTFKTAHVQDNEIVKANDFEFAFEQLVENVSKATQMFLESNQDFVINGKVLPYQGMNVQISPIYGVCKSTGKPFGRTETAVMEYGFAESTSGRIDIIEVQGDWKTFDNQQRAFNDPDTDTQTYQYVDTKKLLRPVYRIKQGTEGSSVAPEVDAGWVKLAEVVIRANNSEIEEEDIKNITSDVAGESNADWTTQPTITYNIGYISDVNARFRVQHNEDGTHKDNVINTDSLDIGTGAKQVNGNVLPVGGALTIPSQAAISATDSILSVLTKAITVITSLYNSYLLYGTYGFNGELSISTIADGNNALTKPIKISADGSGNATIKIDNTTVLTIDTNGKLHTSGYSVVAGDNNNTIVTKAVTDAISSSLTSLAGKVTTVENTLATQNEYANGTLSAGTDGRYNPDSTSIYAATTQNITLSGSQTIDGVSLTDGVYVLVKDQTDATENGIYQYSSNSTWSRVSSFLSPTTLKAKIFSIQNGTVNGKKMFYMPKVTFNDPSDFGIDEIDFLEYFGAILPAEKRLVMRDSNGCAKVSEPNSSNDAVTKNYVDPVIIASDSNNNVKVVTGAPTLKANMNIKFLFTATMTGTDDSTGMQISYNGSAISLKAVKNGQLVDVKAHELTTGNFTYIQAYTTIEVIYNSSYFVIVGNPVVLSSDDYTIYADGKIGDEKVGDIKPQSTNRIPYGWMEGKGQAISRTKYAKLFQEYSTQTYDDDPTHTLLSRYGTGDGSTTFNLPDYREVALTGIGSNGTDTIATHDVYTLGQFKDDQMQKHTHTINGRYVGENYGLTGGGYYATNPLISNYSQTTSNNNGRTGTQDVTHGKQKGVIYLVKVL